MYRRIRHRFSPFTVLWILTLVAIIASIAVHKPQRTPRQPVSTGFYSQTATANTYTYTTE